jgi:uncharacterized protein (TIGR02246 family)
MALTAADELEIMELASRYNWAIDHRNAEEWADLFTDDGKFMAYGETRAVGRAQLVAYVEKAKANGHKNRHWTANAIVEEGGAPDTARLRLYIMAIDISEGIKPYIMGDYDDTVVKVGGKWKFKQRNVNLAAGKSWTQGGAAKAAASQ